MIPKLSVLSDSLTLRSITTDKFKTGTLTFSVRYPNAPLASPYSLLLCELLRSCTRSFPTKASFARRLDELYSTSVSPRCIPRGENRILTFTAEMLDNEYATEDIDIADSVCEILRDVMLHPLLDANGCFPESSFEQEKRRVISYLRSTVNNPARYALQRVYDLTLRDDPSHLDIQKKIEALEECDSASLTEYYQDDIACRPIDVFYIGSLSHEQIAQRVSKHLVGFSAKRVDAPLPLAPRYPIRDTAYLDEEMPITQGRLAIALRTDVCGNDDGYYAMSLVNEILGGGAASKLFMNVREKLSLCYSCYSTYSSESGEITVSSGIDPANREIAQRAILAELEDIKKGNISDKEFSAAKLAIENSYKEIYDNPYGIISYYVNRIPIGIDVTIEECRQKFSALTFDDVVSTANKITVDSVYFLSGSNVDGNIDEEDGEYDE